jgi:hypothetical protein
MYRPPILRHPLAEAALIVVLLQAALSMAFAGLAPTLQGPDRVQLDLALLLLMAAPAVYWRIVLVPRKTFDADDRTVRSAVFFAASAQATGLMLTLACVGWQLHHLDQVARDRFEIGTDHRGRGRASRGLAALRPAGPAGQHRGA